MTRRPHNPRSVRRAFTLIEVIASMLLIALVLPVVMKGISLATRAAAGAKQRTEAIGLAQSKLHELLATGEWQTSNLSGNFSPDYPQYQWSAQLQNWTPPSGYTQGTATSTNTNVNTVEELDVTVTSNQPGGQPITVTLTTLVYPNGNPITASSSSSTSTGTSTGTTTGGAR